MPPGISDIWALWWSSLAFTPPLLPSFVDAGSHTHLETACRGQTRRCAGRRLPRHARHTRVNTRRPSATARIACLPGTAPPPLPRCMPCLHPHAACCHLSSSLPPPACYAARASSSTHTTTWPACTTALSHPFTLYTMPFTCPIPCRTPTHPLFLAHMVSSSAVPLYVRVFRYRTAKSTLRVYEHSSRTWARQLKSSTCAALPEEQTLVTHHRGGQRLATTQGFCRTCHRHNCRTG